jgi:hypothetical protein
MHKLAMKQEGVWDSVSGETEELAWLLTASPGLR